MKSILVALFVLGAMTGCQTKPTIKGPYPLSSAPSSSAFGSSYGDNETNWSPDGTRVLAVHPDWDKAQVQVVSAEGPSWKWDTKDKALTNKVWSTSFGDLLRTDDNLLLLGYDQSRTEKNMVVFSSSDQGASWSCKALGSFPWVSRSSRTLACSKRAILLEGPDQRDRKRRKELKLVVSDNQGVTWSGMTIPFPEDQVEFGRQWRYELDMEGRLHAVSFPASRKEGDESREGVYYLRSSDLKVFDVVDFQPLTKVSSDGFGLGINRDLPEEVYLAYNESTVAGDDLVKTQTAHLFMKLSHDGGKSWSSPFEVASSEKTVGHVEVEGFGDFIVVSWSHFDKGGVYSSVSLDRGRTWSTPQPVVDDGATGEHYLSVSEKGALYTITKTRTAAEPSTIMIVSTKP